MAMQWGGRLLMFGAVMVWSGVAAGQSKESDGFRFGIGAGIEFTDNRDSAEDDLAEDNTDISVVPRVDARTFGDSSILNFHYAPQIRFRDNPSDSQNDSEVFHDLGVEWLISGPVTDWRFIDTFNITDDPAIERDGATLRRDSSYMMNRIEAGMDHKFSDHTMLDVEGNHKIKQYDDADVADQSDENLFGVTGTLSHKLSPETLVAIMGDASSYGYESSEDYNRDFDSVILAGGLEHIFTPDFRGGFRAGVQSLEYNDSDMDGDSMPYFRVGIVAGQAPGVVLNTYATVAVRDSDVFPFASQEESELYAELLVHPGGSPTTVLGLAATIRTDTFDEDQLPDGGIRYQQSQGFDTSGDKSTMVLEGSFQYDLGMQTQLKLAHRIEDVSSDVSVEYNRNSTSLFITRQF